MSRFTYTCLFILLSMSGHGRELILSFHSDILLKESGQIKVTETIQVKAEGINIKRGIYRDFPTQYMGSWLTKKEVGFTVYSVFRDGHPEPFKLERLRNGFRIYIGSADVYLQPGVYTYELTYFTNRQLGYHDQHDEFYWNVTGNGWDFEILQASTAVHLPNNAIDVVFDQQGWTGYQGEQQQNFTLSNKPQSVEYQTTQPLLANQGLTIGLSFPKGVFNPEPFDLAAFLAANLVWLLAMVVGLVYAVFCLVAWSRFGKDPEPGVIVARYRQPKNLSPAAVHYIENQGANDKTLSTAILSLAVKGYVKIKQEKKRYKLSKKSSDVPLSVGERTVFKKLYTGRNKSTHINKQYNSKLRSAKNSLVSVLRKEYQIRCFRDNKVYVIWAWVISSLAFFLGTLLLYGHAITAWDLVFFCFAGSMALIIMLGFFLAAPIIGSIFVLLILSFAIMDLYTIVTNNLPWLMFTLFLLVANLVFGYLMRSPTLYGRHLKDEIDGLKLYMKAAEEHRLNMMNPPEQNKEHFETLFPYALALGLENRWSEQFADLFNTDPDHATKQSPNYQPSWFESDNHAQFSGLTLSRSTRAFGRSMAAAAVKPSSSGGSSYSSSGSYSSSSSYSSSGGSSGGGGGGGGGGGW